MRALVVLTVVMVSAVALHAEARDPQTKVTVCKIKTTQGRYVSQRCTATQEGGAGVSVLTYKIENKEYAIVSDDNGESLNDKPYKTYLRDAKFKTTRQSKPAYFCYVTSDVEFCAKQ